MSEDVIEVVRLKGTLELLPLQTKVQDSTMKIGWCLSKKLTEELAELEAVKPMLLISVTHIQASEFPTAYTETSRQLVPLALGSAFVSFSRDGETRVLATVVWSKTGDTHSLKRIYLERKSATSYTVEVVRVDADSMYENFATNGPHNGHHPVSAILEVEVPEGVFSKDPMQWWAEYQAKFFRTKPFDQCHSRKRFLLAGWTIPFFLAVTMLFRLLWGAIRAFFGVLPTNWAAIFRPFRYNFKEIAGSDQYSMWFCKKNMGWSNERSKKVHDEQPAWRWLINPPIQLGLWLVVFGISSIGTNDEAEPYDPLIGFGFWESLAVSIGLQLGIALLVVIVMFVVAPIFGVIGNAVVYVLPKSWKDSQERQRLARLHENRRIEEARATIPKDRLLLESLVCNTEGPTPVRDKSELPRRLQFRLLFDNTKNKVCRPYRN